MASGHSVQTYGTTYLKLLISVSFMTGLNILPTDSFPQITPPITIDGTLQGLEGSGTNSGFQELSGQDITVTREMGLVRGSNLFHSFGRFNVPTAGKVTFTGPSAILNILSRVTGSDISNINGTIASMIEGANLFLMNPQGIIFGENASLDIKGSFYATTANNIELIDMNGSSMFNAVSGPADALLTSAPPEAFGFLNGSPAGITVDQSTLSTAQKTLEVNSGETISIIGGNIDITGAPPIEDPGPFPPLTTAFVDLPTLNASGGQILLTSVAQGGEGVQVNIETGEASMETNLGNISIRENSNFNTIGDPTFQNGQGGSIIIRSGELLVIGTSFKTRNAASSTGKSGNVNLHVSATVDFTNSEISTGNTFGGAGPGGVTIEAGQALTFKDSQINAQSVLATGTGDPIFLKAPIIELNGGGELGGAFGPTIDTAISVTADPLVRGTDVILEGAQVTLKEGAFIFSNTTGKNIAGNVILNGTDSVTISGIGGDLFKQSGVSVNTSGSGRAGNIDVSSKRLNLIGGGGVFSTTQSEEGTGGKITVNATEEVTVVWLWHITI